MNMQPLSKNKEAFRRQCEAYTEELKVNPRIAETKEFIDWAIANKDILWEEDQSMSVTAKQLWKLNDLAIQRQQPVNIQLPMTKEQASIQIQTLVLELNLQKMEAST